MLEKYWNPIIHSEVLLPEPDATGYSMEIRPILAYKLGEGHTRISLLAGCHADEPAGTMLLKRLVTYLSRQEAHHPLLNQLTWFIVPDANPDGAAFNLRWTTGVTTSYDLVKYLTFVVRDLPGYDLEFGFPKSIHGKGLRPENDFLFHFWQSNRQPFDLHVSLHSMSIGFGAYFLLDGQQVDRNASIMNTCAAAVSRLGYPMHDIDRKGEKGFYRIQPGFAAFPTAATMKQYFLERGDHVMADRFYPTSMECMQYFGGNCLSLVSEIPLFLLPRTPPLKDLPSLEETYAYWRNYLTQCQVKLLYGKQSKQAIVKELIQMEIRSIPVFDQMSMQLGLINAGLTALFNP